MHANAVVVSVVESDPFKADVLLRSLEGVADAETHDTVEGATGACPAQARQVLVLGPSQAKEDCLEQVMAFVGPPHGHAALLVVDSPSTDLLRAALRAGLDDIVPWERVADALGPAVKDLMQRPDDAASPPTLAERANGGPGRIVAVFAPKGGVGRTTVAVNLAVILVRRTTGPVVIVDADPQLGDVAMMLRVTPEHSMLDVLAAGERLDPVLLRSLLARHEESGVRVLAAPTDPSSAAKFTPQAVSVLLHALREMGGITVIDMSRDLNDVNLQLLASSDDIVYLVGMEVPAVKNARLGLQALEIAQGASRSPILVLNRADSKVGLTPRDIERAMAMKVSVGLPSDALVPSAANIGRPAVLTKTRSRFAARMNDLAELLLARAQAEVTL